MPCAYWAHSQNASGVRHRLADHLEATARLARRFAEDALPGRPELHEEAYWAGLWHDLGKYSDRFQQRLADPSIHGVEHWRPGAVGLSRQNRVPAALAVFGHHVGIPDHDTLRSLAAEGESGLPESVETILQRYDACCGLGRPSPGARWSGDHWTHAMLVRLLFSSLVDADFLDTERHFEPETAARRDSHRMSFDPSLWLSALLRHADALAGRGGEVNRVRAEILRACLDRGADSPGLFSLTVPTGGGKTLASLAFALRHAQRHGGFRRVIVVLPYTSIIEQTAEVYRSVLGESAVLEHHSAREPGQDEAELRYRLASENWDAPVIVTTQVQFFDSLFSHRPGPCRKLHRIARSLIIFDEVQTLTGPLLRPLLAMVRELSRSAGCTAVLSTATPNCLGPAAERLDLEGWIAREIIPDPSALARRMRRVRIIMPERYEDPTPLSFVSQSMAARSQALCIVNRKDDAEDLHRLLPKEGAFHLSTRMCPAHRAEVLRLIRDRLAAGDVCRVAATQCVEAGVDLDFPAVWRALGPLDSILQAAGRCNREGRRPLEDSEVRVFVSERKPPSGTYAAATGTAEIFARSGVRDLFDPDEVSRYFKSLYDSIDLDQVRVDGEGVRSVDELTSRWRFETVGRCVRLIRDDSVPVVVPYGDRGRAAFRLLKCYTRRHGRKPVPASLAKGLAPLCVTFYAREAARLEAEGSIERLPSGALLWQGHYDRALGCVAASPEDMIL
ncbi:MAG: CRISPR-associated helicase Cas3' [Elusimicrobia bacterium]|nr:CRISPR-associated helicase Cas3' [Elusimicrobiota bacterium]